MESPLHTAQEYFNAKNYILPVLEIEEKMNPSKDLKEKRILEKRIKDFEIKYNLKDDITKR